MSRKAFVPTTIAPLQRVIAEPITDPVEQARIDKLRKKRKRKQRARADTLPGNRVRAASKSAPKKTA